MKIEISKVSGAMYRVLVNNAHYGYAHKETRTAQNGLHAQRVTAYEFGNVSATTIAALKAKIAKGIKQ